MKKLAAIVGVIAAFVLVSAASAADMPVKARAVAPAPAPMFNWTGIYVGGHGGGDWSNNTWDVPLSALNIAGGCGGCPRPAGSHTASSWLAGVQAGFNYQMGMWVWGAEADVSWTNLNGSSVSLFIPPSTINSKTDSLGTIAARLGVTPWDRTLIFVKGGGAWAHDDFFTTLIGAPSVAAQENKEYRWGWMVGAGLEYAVWQNWSVKVEYNHLDLGKKRETLAPIAGCCTPFEYDVKQTIDLVKVGLNYRFVGLH
jgi:outer membrane immunogenic protein